MTLSRYARAALLSAAAAAGVTSQLFGQTAVTFTGADGGSWSVATNWTGGVVPANSGPNTFAASIASNRNVFFDLASPTTISQLAVGQNALVTQMTGTNLTVLGTVTGGLVINAATFTSSAATGSAVDGGRFDVRLGGRANLSAVAYSAAGVFTSAPIFSADAVGSQVNAASIANISLGTPSGQWFHSIQATNGGLVNLGGLTSINTASGEDDVLTLTSNGGGSINLSSLASITNNGNPNSSTRFSYTGATQSLPALTSAQRTRVTLGAGGVVNAGNLTSLTKTSVVNLSDGGVLSSGTLAQIDNSVFLLSGGSTFNRVSDTVYSTNELFLQSQPIFQADGASTSLGLSTIQTLNLGTPNGQWFHSITGSNGGLVNLSGLTSINGAAGEDDVLTIDATNGGTVNLNALASITNQGNSNVSVQFNVGTATQNLPALAAAEKTRLVVTSGGAASAPLLTTLTNLSVVDLTGTGTFNSGTLSQVDGSRFIMRAGASFNRVSDASYSTGQLFAQSADIFRSEGPGSSLGLSSIQSMQLGTPNGQWFHNVVATGGGLVNLSGLVSIATAAGEDDVLTFSSSAGGTINLNGLATITDAGNSNSYVQFTVGGGITQGLAALTSTQQTRFVVSAGATVSAGNLTSLTQMSIVDLTGSAAFNSGTLSQIDSSAFIVRSGASFNRVSDAGVTLSQFFFQNGDLYRADGAGSSLAMPSIQSIQMGTPFGQYFHNITANAGGQINLAGLQSIGITANEDDVLFFTASGGTITLSALATISDQGNGNNGVGFNVTNSVQNLPALTTAQRTAFKVGAGGTVNAPIITAYTSGTINLSGGGTFAAANLANVVGTQFDVSAGATLAVGTLTQIDSARFILSGGTTFDRVSDAGYTLAQAFVQSANILSADGAGTSLSLPSIVSFQFGTPFSQYFHTVNASNAGQVNLSGVQTISIVNNEDDVLTFNAASGGTINLGALQTISDTGNGNNGVAFSVTSATQSLPALVSAGRTAFRPGAAGTISAPILTTLTNGTVSVAASGTFNAPALVNVMGSELAFAPARTINVGTLTEIDSARISVSGGVNFNRVSDTSYSLATAFVQNANVLSADGASSVLDLSSVSSFRFGTQFTQFNHTVTATNGAQVLLPNVTDITITNGEDDILNFVAASGGTITLGAIRGGPTTGNTSARLNLSATTGGRLRVNGSLTVQPRTTLTVADGTSHASVKQTLDIRAGGQITIAPGGTLSIGGDFLNANTDESRVATSSGEIVFDGSGVQRLELAGIDAGAVNPGNNGNFGFGQMIVGQTGQSTIVQVQDIFDNGNRNGSGGSAEALYLFGQGGPDGLVMRGGSSLIVGNLNVYAFLNASLVNLQSLFTGSLTVAAYTFNGSDGYIVKNTQNLQLFYVNPSSGNWDVAANWTGSQLPAAPFEVFITPTNGLTVNGPLGSETVRSLTIDALTSGMTMLNLSNNSTLTVSNGLFVRDLGILSLSNGRVIAGSVLNGNIITQTAGTSFSAGSGLSSGSITSDGTFNITGAMVNTGRYRQNSGISTIGNIEGTGTTSIGGSAILSTNRIRQGQVDATGSITVAAGQSPLQVNRVGTLSISGGGRWNLADTAMIVDSTARTTIGAFLASGYNGGSWNGAGLNSSVAGVTPNRALGYAQASDVGLSTFLGESVSPASVLVRYTLPGDANLDGIVNISDFSLLAANFNLGSYWAKGDFNYSGTTTIGDFALLAANFNLVLPPQRSLARASSAVPEPGMLALGLIAPILARRRR